MQLAPPTARVSRVASETRVRRSSRELPTDMPGTAASRAINSGGLASTTMDNARGRRSSREIMERPSPTTYTPPPPRDPTGGSARTRSVNAMVDAFEEEEEAGGSFVAPLRPSASRISHGEHTFIEQIKADDAPAPATGAPSGATSRASPHGGRLSGKMTSPRSGSGTTAQGGSSSTKRITKKRCSIMGVRNDSGIFARRNSMLAQKVDMTPGVDGPRRNSFSRRVQPHSGGRGGGSPGPGGGGSPGPGGGGSPSSPGTGGGAGGGRRASEGRSSLRSPFRGSVSTEQAAQQAREGARMLANKLSRAAVLPSRRLAESDFLLELYTYSDVKGVILPTSRLRTWWDMMILVMVLYTALSLPIVLAYPDADATFDAAENFELSMDVVFMIDIGLNCRTAFVRHSELIIDRKQILRRYLKRWFTVDLIASIPWEAIFRIYEATQPSPTSAVTTAAAAGSIRERLLQVANASGEDPTQQQAQVVTLVKLLKVPKLLRIGRVLKVLERVEGAANVGRIFVLMLLMAVIVHWISCAWFGVADQSPEGYLAQIGVRGEPWYDQYLTNYYTTLMMVMGDSIGPVTNGEKFFASVVVLVGAAMNATIFANVAAYVAMIGAPSARHKARIESIVRATKIMNLPRPTAARIRSYFDYCWLKHMDFAGQDLVDQLPVQLRKSVALQTHEHKLRTFELFGSVSEQFLAALASLLVPEVYLPDEYILVHGQVSRCAYFIKRGRVNIIMQTTRRSAPSFIVRQDYFGELGLFQAKQQLYSARAMTHVDTYVLNRADFENIMVEHPAEAVEIADKVPRILAKKDAKDVSADLYRLVGMRDLRRIMTRGKWFPLKGLAQKIRDLAKDPDFRKGHEIQVRGERRRRNSVGRVSSHGAFDVENFMREMTSKQNADAAAAAMAKAGGSPGAGASGDGALARALEGSNNSACNSAGGPLDDHNGDYEKWASQPKVRVPRVADDVVSTGQVAYQRAANGFMLHVPLRRPWRNTYADRSDSACLHAYLDCVPPIFAAELERLSLSIIGPCVPRDETEASVQEKAVVMHHLSYGSRLSSLRVLEVLEHETSRSEILDLLAIGALAHLVRATSSSLRTLCLVSGSLQLDDLRPILRDVGGHVHYISLFLPGLCDVREHHRDNRSGYGILLQPMTVGMVHARQRGDPRLYYKQRDATTTTAPDTSSDYDNSNTPVEDGAEPELPADLHAEIDEEMETDMLETMAQGLCVTLVEPARVLAHLPGWGEAARRQCAAALPLAHWLR